jgi:hypothetical protein
MALAEMLDDGYKLIEPIETSTAAFPICVSFLGLRDSSGQDWSVWNLEC